MIKEWIRALFKPMMEEAIEEAYVKGGEDMARRLAYVFDIVRDKAREEGLTDVGAIEIPEISADEFDKLARENLI